MTCFKCGDREVGCHARCEKYAAMVKENAARKQAEFVDHDIDSYHFEMVLKSRAKGNKMEKKRRKGLIR